MISASFADGGGHFVNRYKELAAALQPATLALNRKALRNKLRDPTKKVQSRSSRDLAEIWPRYCAALPRRLTWYLGEVDS
jgi:hypothetical protein